MARLRSGRIVCFGLGHMPVRAFFILFQKFYVLRGQFSGVAPGPLSNLGCLESIIDTFTLFDWVPIREKQGNGHGISHLSQPCWPGMPRA